MRWALSVPAGLALVLAIAGCSAILGLDASDDDDSKTSSSGSKGSSGARGASSSGTFPGSSSGSSCTGSEVPCVTGCCTPQTDRGQPNFVAAGKDVTCVTTTTGLVYCWGANDTGQLGQNDQNGATPGIDSNVPLKMLGVEGGATQVGAGNGYVCVLANEHVSCTGSGLSGELGDGATGRNVLGPVRDLDQVHALSTGTSTACVLRGEGQVWCWGYNSSMQAGGDSTFIDVKSPTRIGSRSDYRHVAVGWMHACASHDFGVECWGGNGDQQYRLGILENRLDKTPVQVVGISSGPTSLAAGQQYTCADLEGAVCWGRDGADKAFQPARAPTGISTGVTSVSVGNAHACAVRGGSVKCWGSNDMGQMGNSAVTAPTTTPQPVAVNAPVTQVACGFDHTCALLENHTVKCWGNNTRGAIGAGIDQDTATSPLAVPWE